MLQKKSFYLSVIAVSLTIFFFKSLLLNAHNNSNEVVSEHSGVFRAGAATANITPALGGGLIGNFGVPPPATYVHDELHARCLVLDDGSDKLVFIIADLIGINRDLIDEAKRLIMEETQIPMKNILISAVHTHSATSALGEGELLRVGWVTSQFDDYQKFLIRRFADAARIAVNNLEPARIGWGVGSVPQHVFVRRWKMKPGTPVPNPFGGQDKVKTNPGHSSSLLEPASQPDPEVSFISVQSKNGRPIALLANYSLHYVGGVPKGHISADYFAVFADRIQELLKADRLNPPFVGIMSNGTSGDVNNINFRIKGESNPPYAKMQRVADDVALEVLRVYNTIEYHDWVRLQAEQEELILKVRKPDQKMAERARMVVSRSDAENKGNLFEKTYAEERTLKMLDYPDNFYVLVQAVRIGDLGIAAIPFETFAETGKEIKAKSKCKQSFTIELANGYFGYLPTPEQHALGGYETWLGTNYSEIESSRKIVATLLKLFAEMK